MITTLHSLTDEELVAHARAAHWNAKIPVGPLLDELTQCFEKSTAEIARLTLLEESLGTEVEDLECEVAVLEDEVKHLEEEVEQLKAESKTPESTTQRQGVTRMFPIQITINNIDELGKVMESLGLAEPVSAPEPKAAKQEPKAKAAEVKKEETKPAEQETARDLTEKTAAEAVETLHGHAARPTPAVTYVECAKAVTDLSKAKGRDAAVAVLAQFEAKNLKEVPEDKFGDVVTACRAAMEA